jgi:hypothetical protein
MSNRIALYSSYSAKLKIVLKIPFNDYKHILRTVTVLVCEPLGKTNVGFYNLYK